MNKTVSVLTIIPNLLNELRIALPNLIFEEIDKEKPSDQLYQSYIVVADSDLLKPHLRKLNAAKWVQCTWAGMDSLNREDVGLEPLPYTLTRFSGIHFGRQMSEYVLSAIINHERQWSKLLEYKNKACWYKENPDVFYRTISDLTVGILGLGTIGSHVAETLHHFGASVLGLSRSASPNESVRNFIKKYFTTNQLPSLLSSCDYIVNVLPATNETKYLLGGNVLSHCSNKMPVFINVGRGSIIKEEDLVTALNQKWISAAILDVFENEPLPSDSPLWKMPQVFITPHNAAVSRPKDIAEQFALNYKLYEDGQPLLCAFDLTRGY